MGEDGMVNVQIFGKTEKEKQHTINSIIYNYDHETNGITGRNFYYYKEYKEDLAIKCRLWIEDYQGNLTQDKMVRSAFNY
jgi:RNA-binding protein YhbY